MSNRVYTAVKLSPEERKILETIAKSYDVTLSDVIRIAIKEYAQKHRNVLEKIDEETT
jgi:predicted transcriptional regulator